MELAVRPCRQACCWRPTSASDAAGDRLFACRGCGSQWTRGQAWTPVDADGSRPPGVAEELSATRTH